MVLNLSRLQCTVSMIDGERGTKIPHQLFLDEDLGTKRTNEELVITVGADAHARPQIKIWLRKFSNNESSCQDAPRTERPPLILGPKFAALLQKYPFASARVLAQHFLTRVPTIKEILQGELGLKNSPGAGCPNFCPLPKTLLVLKHQQRCYEFDVSRKRTILKELQQVTSPL
jgi:hypothetical protein